VIVPGRPDAEIYPIALLLSLGLVLMLTPLAIRLARRWGFVAHPSGDRWHQRTTPMLGGVAIFLATIPVFTLLPQAGGSNVLERFWALVAGAVLIFALGLYDDVRGLAPAAKVLGQIVAACVLLLQFGPPGALNKIPFALLTVPLIIIWVVGVTNAFNLLDNMDGLSAGIAGIVALTIFLYNHIQGDRQTAVLALLVAGACGGFLVFNFNPARVFMGDCGSLLLGYVLSSAVVLGAAKAPTELLVAVFVPVAVMALPILDTTLVTVLRAANRRPISQGGRDHLSHRLVALGLNERQAVLILYLISAAAGSLAIGASYLGPWMAVSLGGLLAIAVVLFAVYLGQVRIYSEVDVERLEASRGLVGRLVLGGNVLYKRQFATVLLDLALACLSLSAAYLLRYDLLRPDGVIEKRFVEQFAQVLPFIIIFKLPFLYFFGAYRSVWRYTGAADVIAFAKAGTLGSLLASILLFVVYRAEALNRSVLVIDWLLFLVLIIGSRLSFVFMQEWLSHFRRQKATRVLIVGAGDTGELMLRAINRRRRRTVVGFLDDDPTKQQLSIHGVPVVGTSKELSGTVRRLGVDEVLLAVGAADTRAELIRDCQVLGVPLREVGQFFQDQLDREGSADGRPGTGREQDTEVSGPAVDGNGRPGPTAVASGPPPSHPRVSPREPSSTSR
jgi:UDP-GlcNAc:undecaprenyl-phosphate GlcNAc-1-phosphate transferase